MPFLTTDKLSTTTLYLELHCKNEMRENFRTGGLNDQSPVPLGEGRFYVPAGKYFL